MKVEKDKVVMIAMKLTEQHGEELEATDPDEPIAYLHGHKNILPALEDALEGLSVGDSKTLTLPPEKAYGQYFEDGTQQVSKKHLKGKVAKLQVGEFVTVNSEKGPMHAQIIKVGLKMVTVDMNHPYAGKTVTFDIEVKAIRDASEGELAQGRAQGFGE